MTIIFDFDGTIADSFDYVLGFLSKEARRMKPVGTEAEAYRYKSMKDVGLQLGIPIWRMPLLYFKGRRVMRAHMDNLHSFEGMPELIKKFNDDGHKLYIISSNSGRNVKRFLLKNNLNQYFWAVWGGAGILGKVNLIKQLRRRYKIKDNVWYIGDEVRDVASAKAAGVKSAAVTWGFASRHELTLLRPDFVADTTEELLLLLNEES